MPNLSTNPFLTDLSAKAHYGLICLLSIVSQNTTISGKRANCPEIVVRYILSVFSFLNTLNKEV
ncbi:MAG: hypothetical protein ABIK93_06660 [candidate division WOR-3 bacterium]